MNTSFQIDDDNLAKLLRKTFNDNSQTIEPITCLGPTYVGLRCNGALLHSYWLYSKELLSTLRSTIIPTIAQGDLKHVDSIELCLTRHYRRVSLKEFATKFPNIKRGIRGIKLQYQSHVVLYSPTQMIADNLTFDQVFARFLEHVALSAEAFEHNRGVIEAFEARQVLISLKPAIRVTMMHRGNQVVSLNDMSRQTIADMTKSMGEWLLQMCAQDGHLLYKYWPSQGKTSNATQVSRQFMATVSLIRYARFTGQPDHLAIADRNLDYNLKRSYRLDSGVGLIEDRGKARLGAAAIAALAILEHPHRDRYRNIFQQLCLGIEAFWQPNGSFHTYYKPPRWNEHQNIDPGQALLFWACLYRDNRDEQLLEHCYRSFFHYREWHRTNRHPAFIPWHTQAYAVLFDVTGDPVFRDFIFEMNNWLLPMQQWDSLHTIDARGRFYDPTRRDYGLPYVGATAGYLQGLTDAYRLAMEYGNGIQASTYELAIWRGLCNIRQLQFKSDIDMFYISERSRIQGAVRTTVYDNTIRLDSVQQSLIAMLKLYHLPEFPERAPQPRSPFRKIKQQVNIAPLMAEISAKSAFWSHDTSRQQKLTPQQEPQSIFPK
jgi:hypothetical protein